MTYPPPLSSLALALLAGCAQDLVVFEPDPEELPPSPASAEDGGLRPSRPGDLGMDAGLDASGLRPSARDASVAPRTPHPLAAFSQTCALHRGDVYCWGDNRLGQCGGPTEGGLGAHVLKGPFVDVCAGEHHSCALRENGEAVCWGSNRWGQLGLGNDAPRMAPTAIPSMRFRALACGGDSSCGIDLDGALYCWGDNFEGKLGTGATETSLGSPRQVAALRAAAVTVGQGHACAITEEGALYCWGRNTDMQVGIAATDAQLRTPQRVDPAHAYRQVAAGQAHTCAVREDARLLCWGTRAPSLFEGAQPLGPRLIDEEPGYDDVAVGWFHSCARKGGTLRCWGRNAEGQLGLGDGEQRLLPTQVGTFTDWQTVTVGHLHTCAVRPNGIYCWGDGELGQLAPHFVGRTPTPTLVPPP